MFKVECPATYTEQYSSFQSISISEGHICSTRIFTGSVSNSETILSIRYKIIKEVQALKLNYNGRKKT